MAVSNPKPTSTAEPTPYQRCLIEEFVPSLQALLAEAGPALAIMEAEAGPRRQAVPS